MPTIKRKMSMKCFLGIKAFLVTGSFDEDLGSFDDDFLNEVSIMNIYVPEKSKGIILDYIKENEKDRKLAELKEFAEFKQYKSNKKKGLISVSTPVTPEPVVQPIAPQPQPIVEPAPPVPAPTPTTTTTCDRPMTPEEIEASNREIEAMLREDEELERAQAQQVEGWK